MLHNTETSLLALVLILPGCTERNTVDSGAFLTADTAEVSAPAEPGPDGAPVTRTVRITANRSWTAVLADAGNPVDPSRTVDWGDLDVPDHVNLARRTETTGLTLTFARNLSQDPVDGTLLLYADSRLMATVPVRQEGAHFHLDAVAERTDVSCDADEIAVQVDCNTGWTASVIDATAEVSLDRDGGFDPGILIVRFAENFDPGRTKTATVRLSAPDCPDKDLVFTQARAVPYLRLEEEPGTLLPGEAVSGTLSFSTNCAWTAETEEAGLRDLVLSATAGAAGSHVLTFTFTNVETDPHETSTALIRIRTEQTDPLEVTFRQRVPLLVDFTQDRYTPSLPTASSAVESTHTFTQGAQSYSISLAAAYFRSYYLMFKGQNGNTRAYIAFPALEGLTLKRVKLTIMGHVTHKNIAARITDEAGLSYSDLFSSTALNIDTQYTFVLDGTRENTSYRLLSTANLNCMLYQILLIYE
ncbi:MAG: hypothetical protein IJ721_05200 [Bacteroidales bacterium]|nr:hypothetical protein [Bacteroidales bacterium]